MTLRRARLAWSPCHVNFKVVARWRIWCDARFWESREARLAYDRHYRTRHALLAEVFNFRLQDLPLALHACLLHLDSLLFGSWLKRAVIDVAL